MGQIGLDRARKQIDLIIYGLSLEDILQSKISDVLVSLNTLTTIYNKVNSVLAIVERFIDIPKEEMNKDDNEILYKAYQSLLDSKKERNSAVKLFIENYEKLKRKTIFLSGMTKDISSDIENITKTLDAEIEKSNEVLHKAESRTYYLKDKLGKNIEKIEQQTGVKGRS